MQEIMPVKRGRPKAEKIVKIEYLKEEHKNLIASLKPLYMFEIKNWREQYKEYTLNGLIHYMNEYAKSLDIELLIVRIGNNLEIERSK